MKLCVISALVLGLLGINEGYIIERRTFSHGMMQQLLGISDNNNNNNQNNNNIVVQGAGQNGGAAGGPGGYAAPAPAAPAPAAPPVEVVNQVAANPNQYAGLNAGADASALAAQYQQIYGPPPMSFMPPPSMMPPGYCMGGNPDPYCLRCFPGSPDPACGFPSYYDYDSDDDYDLEDDYFDDDDDEYYSDDDDYDEPPRRRRRRDRRSRY